MFFKKPITRRQYFNGEYTHDEYYGQFAKSLVPLVKTTIGVNRIKNSNSPNFNDIPLSEWDSLFSQAANILLHHKTKLFKAGLSLSDAVCALKAAAKLIRNEKLSK